MSKKKIEITNRVRIPKHGCEDAIRELIEGHTYANPDYAKAKARSKWGVPKKIPKELHTWKDHGDSASFPRGSLDRISEVLTENHISFELVENTSKGAPELQAVLNSSPLISGRTPRPYQAEQMVTGLRESTCLWRAPPGSGKTSATIGYIAKLNKPALVVVPSASVFSQWQRRIEEELGLSYDQIGMLGGGYSRIRPITIAMQQTLKNHGDKYAKTFGIYVADEVQLHGSATFSAVSDQSHAHYRLGVSGDERRADDKQFLIYDLFGPVKHEVHKSQLIEEGYIHDAEIRVIPTETTMDWYTKLKGMKKASGPVQDRMHVSLAEDAGRNELIAGVIRWCMDQNEQTLLLAWRIKHCHKLNAIAAGMGYKCGLMIGGPEQKTAMEESRVAMEDGSLQIAAGTYQAIGVGFDLPALSRGIMAAPCANNPKAKYQFGQYTGRFERISADTDKKDAILYYIWDRRVFGNRPLENLVKWRKRVRVLAGNGWVPGKQYLSDMKKGRDMFDDMLA